MPKAARLETNADSSVRPAIRGRILVVALNPFERQSLNKRIPLVRGRTLNVGLDSTIAACSISIVGAGTR